MVVAILAEGVGVLFCLAVLLRVRPGNKKDLLCALGNVMPGPIVRYLAGKVKGERAEVLFPDAPAPQAAISYIRMNAGLWFLLTLTFSLLLTVLYVAAGNNNDTGLRESTQSLQRPAFEEKDQNIRFEVEAERDGASISKQVTIEIPRQEPNEEDLDALFQRAEDYVVDYFSEYSLHAGVFPERFQDVSVLCLTRSDKWIDQTGTILWENIQEPVRAKILVHFSAYGKEKEFLADCPLTPKEETMEEEVDRMVERLRQGAYLSKTTIDLPQTGENDMNYHWYFPDTSFQIRKSTIFLWIACMPLLILLYHLQRIKMQIKDRKRKIYRRYPDMLNKMTILMGSGMSAIRAWETITSDYRKQKERGRYKEPLYEEMQLAENRFHNGISFLEAVRGFAQRTGIKEIRQFAAIMRTSWQRGDDRVLIHLKDLHDRSWEIRKNQTRKLSEEADTKLLLPLIMMLLVVMIIVLTPALMTMSM